MAPLRVLLVEDHETVRAGLRLIIDSQADMRVVGEAPDGTQGLTRIHDLAPDVVVMDVSMPGMNGIEATRSVRAACPSARVVTLTRYREAGYVELAMHAGASAYVLKQSRPSELLSAIRAVGIGATYMDSSISSDERGHRTRRLPVTPDGSDPLSARESQVLQLIARGHSNKEVAAQLDVSVKTIETHKANAMRKLGLNGRIDLVRYALLHGWMRDV